MPDERTPFVILKEVLNEGMSGSIHSIAQDIKLTLENGNMSINGKPLGELLERVTSDELLKSITEIPSDNDLLINKLIIVMNKELGMKLPCYEQGERMSPQTEDAMRIFTKGGFSHIANNLLTKSLNLSNKTIEDIDVKIDIKNQTREAPDKTHTTTDLIITNTCDVHQIDIINIGEHISSKNNKPLITCESMVTLPVRMGALQADANRLVIKDIHISSDSTHESVKSLSTALNQVDVQNMDFEVLDAQHPLDEAPALKGKILEAYEELQPKSWKSRFMEWRNEPQRKALDKALDCLNFPDEQKENELRVLAKEIKNEKVSGLLIKAAENRELSQLRKEIAEVYENAGSQSLCNALYDAQECLNAPNKQKEDNLRVLAKEIKEEIKNEKVSSLLIKVADKSQSIREPSPKVISPKLNL